MKFTVNVPGQAWEPQIYELLLQDRTTQQPIVWATDDYHERGAAYAATQPMSLELLEPQGQVLIHPGFLKNRLRLTVRQKSKAEVFTPTWMCNIQNNLIDKVWFGREVVFNATVADQRTTVTTPIVFPDDPNKTWQAYVQELRMEVACGEAPYLVSRYDTVSGEPIPITERIGFLDRKLRIVTENTNSEAEWLTWAEIAFKSIYGFELQGDNLLIARSNLLATLVEYLLEVWQREPTPQELEHFAYIISWNLWQMNGVTCATPYPVLHTPTDILDFLFEETQEAQPLLCQIMDWEQGTTVRVQDLRN